MAGEEEVRGVEESKISSPGEKNVVRRFKRDESATNRVLFALALLGVLLPVNSIANHYRRLGYVYYAKHDWYWRGPYHINVILFFDTMEILLAVAVYIYGFDFVFKQAIFQRVGTFLYAAALLVPPLYLVVGAYSLLSNEVNRLPTLLFYVGNVVVNVLFPAALIGVGVAAVAISKRLQD